MTIILFTMDEHLLKILEKSDFTRKEALVYLAVFECGEAVVADIAKKTNLKRPIVYVVIEGLIKRNYLSQIPDNKVNTYLAIDPSVILSQLVVNTRNFQEMLPIFKSVKSKGKSFPKIRYYDTKQGVLDAYDEMARAKEVFFLSSYVAIDKTFPGIFDKWHNESTAVNRKQKSKYLIPDNPEEITQVKKAISTGHKVKALKELEGIKMDFTLFDNKVGISSLEDGIFIVIFESENIVKSMKFIFEVLWAKGRKIS